MFVHAAPIDYNRTPFLLSFCGVDHSICRCWIYAAADTLPLWYNEHPGKGHWDGELLGVHLSNKPNWIDNTNAIYSKGQCRLFQMRRLWSIGLWSPFWALLAIPYGVVCRGNSITNSDRKRLDKLIKKASFVFRSPLEPVQVVGERRKMSKIPSPHPVQQWSVFEEVKV